MKLRKYIIEHYFKVWGVAFQTDLPPEFVITTHAEQRMAERVGCTKAKMQKLVVKAWNGATPNPDKWGKKLYQQKYKNKRVQLKELMGYIWVFDVQYSKRIGYPQKVLITVYN